MKTSDKSTSAAELAEESAAVMAYLTKGTPIDPAIAERIDQRAKAITDEIYAEHGVLDLGVPIIRELRGELPV